VLSPHIAQMLTPLARNIIISVSTAGIAYVYSTISLSAAAVCVAGGIGASITFSAVKDRGMTYFDCLMINLDRLMNGKAPQGNITGVFWFDEAPTHDDVIQSARVLASSLKRFRTQAVVATPAVYSTYKDIDNFDPATNVHSLCADDDQAVRALIEQQANVVLPYSAPLWRMTLITNKSGGRSAIVLQVNHCLGDGLRFVSAFGRCKYVSFEDGSPAELGLLKKMSAKKSKRVRPSILSMAKDFVRAATLNLDGPETATPLHRPKSLFGVNAPRAAITAEMPFADIKAIQKHSQEGTTVNDVLYAGFGGAIDRYITQVCADGADSVEVVSAKLMRALMAISMPDLKSMGQETYNNFILASVQLPTGLQQQANGAAGPLLNLEYSARLSMAKTLMDGLKKSSVGPIAGKLAEGLMAVGLDGLVVDTNMQVFANHSFVFSNVPGYDQTIVVANKKVVGMAAFYTNMISQLIFLTYCGTLSIALCTDRAEVQKPQLLVDCFIAYINDWKAACEASR